MWQTNGLLKQIGLQFPIIQAPMAGGATTPELVAAVSNAGALGFLGAGYMTAPDIKQAIKDIRQLTDKPFAVNLFIPDAHQASADQMQKACVDVNQCCVELNTTIKPPTKPYSQPFEEQIKVIIEEQVPVFSFTFGVLDAKWIAELKKNHTILIGTATTVAEALALEKIGVDMIALQGSQAGGHRGTFLGEAKDALIELSDLIPQCVNQVNLPVIAAGGIMDGRGINAAMDLGASAVSLGTAFLTCSEANIHPKYKQALLAQQQDNTVLTRAFSGKLARGIRNKFIERMDTNNATILDYPIQNALTSAIRKQAKQQNNIDFMSLWAGQSAALCRNLNAAELVNVLCQEVENKT